MWAGKAFPSARAVNHALPLSDSWRGDEGSALSSHVWPASSCELFAGAPSGQGFPIPDRRFRAGDRSFPGIGVSLKPQSLLLQPQRCSVGPGGWGCPCRGSSYRAAVPLLQDRVFQADGARPGGDLVLPAEGVPPTPQRPPSLHGECPPGPWGLWGGELVSWTLRLN